MNRYGVPSFAALLLAGLLLAGCDSFLQHKPRSRMTAETLESLEAARRAVNGIYGARDLWNSDDLFGGSLTNIAAVPSPYITSLFSTNLDNFTVRPTNGSVGSVYGTAFEIHNRASTVIGALEEIENEEKGPAGYILRERYLAEARFLRAFADWLLVKTYGGVALPREPVTTEEAQALTRLSREEALNRIKKDLMLATGQADGNRGLPLKEEWPSSELGRPPRGAANMLLTHVHLGLGDYQAAINASQRVIDSGQYSLTSNQFGTYDNYYEVFRERVANGPGSIFELQQALATKHLMTTFMNIKHTPDDNSRYDINGGDNYFNNQDVIVDGSPVMGDNGDTLTVRDTLDWGDTVDGSKVENKVIGGFGDGQGLYQPSRVLAEVFNGQATVKDENGDPIGQGPDPRKFITVMGALDGPGTGSIHPEYGVVWGESGKSKDGVSLFFGKHQGTLEEREANIINFWWGGNRPIFRYAGLLLLHAEAEALAGADLNDAIKKINMVRERADYTTKRHIQSVKTYDVNLRPTGASQTQVLEWVRTERVLELATEGFTWFDLKRYHRHHPNFDLQQFMNDAGSPTPGAVGPGPGELANFKMPKHLLWPLPQREIDLAGFDQNSGY